MDWPPEAADNIIRVLACDPGTSTLGLNVIDIPIDDLDNPRSVWGHTLTVKDERHPSCVAEIDSKRRDRLIELRRLLTEAVVITRPTFFATETPFMRRGMLSAYESGVELQVMIKQAVRDVSLTLSVDGFNPMMVKHYVGVDHIRTDKMEVQKAVYKLYSKTCTYDIMTLDEHSAVWIVH